MEKRPRVLPRSRIDLEGKLTKTERERVGHTQNPLRILRTTDAQQGQITPVMM